MQLLNIIGNKRGASSSSSSSSSSSATKKLKDDENDDGEEDDIENPKYVEEDLSFIKESGNIIPRSKRRAALASGLVRSDINRPSLGSSSAAAKSFDSDDEEGDF